MSRPQAYWTMAGIFPATFGGAMAADIPARSAPVPVGPMPLMVSWSGLYAGLNAGLVAHQAKFSGVLPVAFNNNYAWPNGKTQAPGGIFGAQLGYNFQSGQLVYGVEADINIVAARGASNPVDPTGYAWRQRASMDALGTARVRLGYAFDRALVYATGGLAVANIRDAVQAGPNPAYSWSKGSTWKFGYTVGVGVEYALTNRWSAKLEALYYDLGRQSHISQVTNAGATYGWGARSRSDGFIGRLGLNYKFGGADPVIAKY